MKPKVIIEVNGGCVSDVSSDTDIDLVVVDYDTQGFDEDILFEMPNGDLATCSVTDVNVSAKNIRNLYQKILHFLKT